MRTIFLICAFALGSNFAVAGGISKGQAAAFAKKSGCYFAAGLVVKKGDSPVGKPGEIYGSKIDSRGYPVGHTILCVWDGVLNQGSVHEQAGCMAGNLHLETGKYFGFSSSMQALGAPALGYVNPAPVVINESCSRVGIVKILKEKKIKPFDNGPGYVWDSVRIGSQVDLDWLKAKVEVLNDEFDVEPLLSLSKKDREARLSVESKKQEATTSPAGEGKPVLDSLKGWFK